MRVLMAGVAIALAFDAQFVTAQGYPEKAIRFIAPYAPGGSTDLLTRTLAQKLTVSLGQTVVADNRPGAGGNVGADIVAKAAPDRYTILLAPVSPMAINVSLYGKKLPFNPERDFAPITLVAKVPLVIVLNLGVPAKTLQEFIDFARKSNPPLNYASTGSGAQQHLAMEMLKARAGLNMAHIPYKGGAGATIAMVAGDVSATIGGSSMDPQIKAGKLRALATTGARRAPSYPDLPTIGEMFPGYTISVWIGLFAPAATPVEVLTRLRGEVDKFLANPETRQKLYASGGMDPYPLRPEEILLGMRRDYEKFGKLIKEIGLRVD